MPLDQAALAQLKPEAPKKPSWWERHINAAKLALLAEKNGPVSALRSSSELEFLPAVLEVTETPASPAGRATLWVICGTFLFGLIWSLIGNMDIVAVAPGKIIPSSSVQVIQPREVGSVRSILVREGQSVKAGEPLIELDPTQSAADTGRLGKELMLAQLESARLRALIDGTSPADFTGVAGASSDDITLHRTYLIRERETHVAAIATLDNEVVRVGASIKATEADISRLEKTLPLAKERQEGQKQLADQGMFPRMKYLEAQQLLIEAEQQLEVQHNRLAESRAQVESLKSQRAKTEAEFTSNLFNRLAQTESQAGSLSQELIKAQDRNRLMSLTSPIDGVVQQIQMNTTGGVVTPAQQLMIVVPANTELEVEALVLNKDIGFIATGQDVEIKVESFPFTRYGTIHGKVRVVPRDAAKDEKLGLVYPVRVTMDRRVINAAEGDIPLGPGMGVIAEVKTGQRRIIEYLIAPISQYVDESMRER